MKPHRFLKKLWLHPPSFWGVLGDIRGCLSVLAGCFGIFMGLYNRRSLGVLMGFLGV